MKQTALTIVPPRPLGFTTSAPPITLPAPPDLSWLWYVAAAALAGYIVYRAVLAPSARERRATFRKIRDRYNRDMDRARSRYAS